MFADGVHAPSRPSLTQARLIVKSDGRAVVSQFAAAALYERRPAVTNRTYRKARHHILPFSQGNQFDSGKEIGDFERCRLRSVGAVDAVVLDVTGVELTDRSRRGLGWVGRAHNLAEPRDDVVAFEDHHQRPPRAHERGQALEKSFAAVDGVEALSFALGKSNQARSDDPETVRLKDSNDVAHVAGGDGIGLDDGERSLDRQRFSPSVDR